MIGEQNMVWNWRKYFSVERNSFLCLVMHRNNAVQHQPRTFARLMMLDHPSVPYVFVRLTGSKTTAMQFLNAQHAHPRPHS